MGLASNIVKVYPNKDPFWGKYEDLNSVKIPSTDEIRKYQLSKLKNFQKNALKNQANNEITQRINTLFQSGNINNVIISQYKNGEDLTIDKALENIANWFGGLYAQKFLVSKGVSEKEYKNINSLCVALTSQLQNIQKKLNIDSILYQQELDKLLELMTLAEQKSLSAQDIIDWTYKINKIKGNLLEEIGVAWLNQMGVPDTKTINTGAINLNTSKSTRHSGQLIQDLMTLNVSNVNLLKSTTISYKMPGETKETISSLEDFLNNLEKHSGSSKQFVIDDKAYDVLLSFSALNIQAKAGKKQLPWNKASKINQVSIGEYQRDNLPITVKKTFKLLHALDTEKPKDIWVKDSSKDYNALANYGLATVLTKVMHLEANEGNQYLLTPYGFMTYTERLEQLFSVANGIAELSDNVTINNDTLDKKYEVTIKGIKY